MQVLYCRKTAGQGSPAWTLQEGPHPHSYLRASLLEYHLLEGGIACIIFL